MGIRKISPKTAVTWLVLSGTLLTAQKADAFTVDNISYEKLTDSTVAVTKGTYRGDVVIPETVSYLDVSYTVTEIAGTAFDSMSGLTSVSLPRTIEKIGAGAFNSCTLLSSIDIPDKVAVIEMETFYGCSGLKSITFPAALKTIGDYAFYGCSRLDGLEFPSGLESVGDYAFANCEYLTTANFPDGCRSISVCAFMSCSSLGQVTLPASLTELSNNCFFECTSLSKITIPESVTRIYPNVFYGCSRLSSVEIKGPVTLIDTGVFDGCSALETVFLPEELQTLGDAAFRRSALEEITIPGNVTSIGYGCFDRCSSLKKVIFSDGAEILDLAEMALGRLNAESLYLGRNLSYIADEYGSTPFYNCTSLKSISIGSYVTDATALYGSRYPTLTSLSSDAALPPTIRPFTEDLYGTVSVTVPEGSLEAYRSAEVWKEFASVTGEEPETKVTVSGKVISINGPVEGASVKMTCGLTSVSAYTDAEGCFSISLSETGIIYNLTVTASGYNPYADVIEVEVDNIELGSIELTASNAIGNISSDIRTVPIYDITGRYVGHSTENLPKGIYIKGETKFIVK